MEKYQDVRVIRLCSSSLYYLITEVRVVYDRPSKMLFIDSMDFLVGLVINQQMQRL
jgi:hypothetical protein